MTARKTASVMAEQDTSQHNRVEIDLGAGGVGRSVRPHAGIGEPFRAFSVREGVLLDFWNVVERVPHSANGRRSSYTARPSLASVPASMLRRHITVTARRA
jgi:hypothetical protein